MVLLNIIIVIFLIICAIAVGRTKDLLSAVIIFSAYSLMMSVLWLILNTPDVALTEAAIGAGVTCILFIAVISRTERYER
ncbi:MAG: hydrogenase subunit MbhD domain-containing protein [Candidatus Izemoplasmataceae bacterium]|jgi:energy-converting hydrogenase B subunit D|uniref:hydrogenase subunit MbhD domain-containing protein n=1 Tax=Liberiplasma polymorphum TaxID=3374570 RepID=UPI003771A42D